MSTNTRVVDATPDHLSGPAALIPNLVEDPLLKWRNTESLRRLAYLAENRR